MRKLRAREREKKAVWSVIEHAFYIGDMVFGAVFLAMRALTML